jgi:predicted esterase YcpF (UPF0227 family)
MLYFIHGYESSPQGEKAKLLEQTLHATPITYRECPPEDLVISQCLERIANTITNDHQVTLIGSSLGGFLAASTALDHQNVTQIILLNPAIIPPESDLSLIEGMPQRILREMRDPRLFEQKIKAKITILRGTNDDIIPDEWIVRFAQAQNATVELYNDDHRFSKNLQRLPEIVLNLIQQKS